MYSFLYIFSRWKNMKCRHYTLLSTKLILQNSSLKITKIDIFMFQKCVSFIEMSKLYCNHRLREN